jgi:phage-related minor tail protein
VTKNLDIALRMKADLDEAVTELTQVEAKLEKVAGSGKQAGAGLQAAAAGADRTTTSASKSVPALGSQDTALKKTTLSAKQYGQAMRQLPMQITDVVTGLASGQSVFMVAIQQGGQLKDTFGGIGPAARALAGSISPMAVAVTAGAAAFAAISFAAYEGYQEIQSYERALISTGNISGVTAGQIGNLADRVGEASGKYGDAEVAALNLAQSGKVAGEALEAATGAAVSLAELTGESIEDTTDKIIKLAASPTEMLVKLNDQYHFLTAEVYEHVRALEAQGDAQGAATLAIEAFAAVHEQRVLEARERAGWLEQAWRGLGNTISGIWDSLKDLGRDDIEFRLETARGTLAALERNRGNDRVWSPAAEARARAHIVQLEAEAAAQRNVASAAGERQAKEDAAIASMAKAQKFLQSNRTEAERQAEAIRELDATYRTLNQNLRSAQARKVLDGVQFDAAGNPTGGGKYQELRDEITEKFKAKESEWDKLRISNLSREQKLEEEIATIRRVGLAERKTEAEIEAQVAAARARFAESRPKGGRSDAERDQAAAERALESLDQQIAMLDAVADGERKASEEARVRYEVERGAYRGASASLQQQLIERAKLLDAARAEKKAEEDKAKALEETTKLYERLRDELQTPIESAASDVTQEINLLNDALAAGIINADKYNEQLRRIGDKALTDAPDAGMLDQFGIGDPEAERFEQANEALREWYEQQQAIIDAGRAAERETNAYWDEQERLAKEQYYAGLSELAIAQNQMQLLQVSSAFGSMAEIAKAFAGEQSKTYQVLFAISKGFAVAQAAVALAENVAQASKIGWPANIGAIAAALAQGAQIAQLLTSAQPPQGYRDGGRITGPGTGTSDSIPIWGSNGEFMVRERSASQPGAHQFLDDFNRRGMSALEDWRGYADGGLITADASRASQLNAGTSQAINNRMRVYIYQSMDAIAAAVAAHPATEKKIVVVAGENGGAIRAEWGG